MSPLIVGLTGSLGTGKTTVAGMFRRLGAYVIDADRIVHGILDKAARKKIASFVFDDRKSIQKLCGLIHPFVKEEIAREIRKNKAKKIIVIDAPLLFESGLHKKCQATVVVKASLNKQIERGCKKLHICKNEAVKRIRFQMPLREKISMADFVIDNNGTRQKTWRQVKQVWHALQPQMKARL